MVNPAATATTKVFLDTESLDTGREIHMISIGLAAETGPEYYAVSADVDLREVSDHAWLNEHVAPYLPVKRNGTSWEWDPAHPEFAAVKPRATIAAEVLSYFTQLTEPDLWAYFSPFDTIVLTQLYGPLSDLPEQVPCLTQDLMQEARRSRITTPEQPPPVHHAPHDARHDLIIASAIGLISPNRSSPHRHIRDPAESAGRSADQPGSISKV
jgi:3' exoribonuclease, RNase T-like